MRFFSEKKWYFNGNPGFFAIFSIHNSSSNTTGAWSLPMTDDRISLRFTWKMEHFYWFFANEREKTLKYWLIRYQKKISKKLISKKNFFFLKIVFFQKFLEFFSDQIMISYHFLINYSIPLSPNLIHNPFRNNIIIESPSDIFSARIRQITPERVLLLVRMKCAERVAESFRKHSAEPSAFFVRESGCFVSVWFRVFQVDFVVGNVEIAAVNDGFRGVERLKKMEFYGISALIQWETVCFLDFLQFQPTLIFCIINSSHRRLLSNATSFAPEFGTYAPMK